MLARETTDFPFLNSEASWFPRLLLHSGCGISGVLEVQFSCRSLKVQCVKYCLIYEFYVGTILTHNPEIYDQKCILSFCRWNKCDWASHLQPAAPGAEAQVGQQAREQ